MEATLYANLNRKTLSEKVEGTAFSWPTLTAGDTVSLRLRFTKRIEGKNQLVDLAIEDVYAAVSVIDARPTVGTFRLKIGPLVDPAVTGTNQTTALAFGATAAQWQTALNVLTLCGGGGDYGAATVTEDNGSYLITFANLTAAGVITLNDNLLSPSTLLRVIPIERDGVFEHDCRLIQSPASMTSTYSLEAGSSPSVVRHRGGSDVDGAAINEIQILTIPPDFNGAAEFERNGLRSAPFGKTFDIEQFDTLLDPLADDGGLFALSNILPNELWIEFQGSMKATAQDLLEVHVVRAPQGDCAFTLDLNQPAVYALLRAADNVDAYVHLVVLYEDADTEEMRRWSYLQKVKLQRPVVWNGLDVNEAIDFLKKPGDTHLPVADGQIITGSQHYTRAFPTTLELSATLFTVTHNLGEDFGHIVVGTDSSPGVRLVEGIDYSITTVSEDEFEIQLLAGGYFATGIVTNDAGTWKFVRTTGGNIACLNHLAVAFSSIGPASAFADHDHFKTDVTGLPEDLADIFGRLVALEARVGITGDVTLATSSVGDTISRPLPRVWNVMRSRTQPTAPDALLGWNPFAEGSTLRDIRLLPAVHLDVDDIEVLPSVLPAAADSYRDRVFYSATDREDFPGGVLYSGQYAACDGRDWYRIAREGEEGSTWYPTLFNLELFRVSISPDELALRTTLDLAFGFEAAMFRPLRRALERGAVARYSLVIERGVRVADATPATTGSNIDTHFGSPVILAQHDFDLTEVPAARRFGLSISRSGAGVLAATATIFNTPSVVSAPATADFVLRARLCRFDVEDLPLDARGIVAVRGLDVGTDGLTDTTLGKYTIG